MTDDKDIIEAVHKNPEQGLKILMSTYGKPLYWHIRRLVVSHDDAEDATQETFIRIHQSFAQYNGKGSFRAWIFRIASNEALRLIGRRKGRDTVSLDEQTDSALFLKSDEWLDNSDGLAAKLQKAILSLPAKQQLTFNMRYYDDMSYTDIAEITNSTVTSAKANYHVAKEKIIQFMNRHDL